MALRGGVPPRTSALRYDELRRRLERNKGMNYAKLERDIEVARENANLLQRLDNCFNEVRGSGPVPVSEMEQRERLRRHKRRDRERKFVEKQRRLHQDNRRFFANVDQTKSVFSVDKWRSEYSEKGRYPRRRNKYLPGIATGGAPHAQPHRKALPPRESLGGYREPSIWQDGASGQPGEDGGARAGLLPPPPPPPPPPRVLRRKEEKKARMRLKPLTRSVDVTSGHPFLRTRRRFSGSMSVEDIQRLVREEGMLSSWQRSSGSGSTGSTDPTAGTGT